MNLQDESARCKNFALCFKPDAYGSSMPKFIVIEHLMRKVGGHYYSHALEVLHAAEAAGFTPVLAISREFSEMEQLPSHWQVLRLFRNRINRIHRPARQAGQGRSLGKSLKSALRWFRRIRHKNMLSFADALQELFTQVSLEPGDQIYCATVEDLNLLGLVRFMQANPSAKVADWHLQFHFSVFTGRDPEYPSQARNVRGLQRRLRWVDSQLSQERVYYYATSVPLTRQLNYLGAFQFDTLPWPVGDQFQPTAHANPQPPLRLVCAGALRPDKGGELLGPLVQALQKDFLQPGRVELLVQCGNRAKELKLLGDTEQAGLKPVPFPLDNEGYVELVTHAHIGLLLYDSVDYFTRCSGILVELLAAGVPVLVPSGCWLSEQIQAANTEHLTQLLQTCNEIQRWDKSCFAADNSATLQPSKACQHGSDLLLRFCCAGADQPGVFTKVLLEQFNAERELLRSLSHSPSRSAQQSLVMFPLAAQASTLRLQFTDPYGNAPVPLQQVEAILIQGKDGHQAMGCLGLAIDSPEFIPQLLENMVNFYQHYRQSTLAFSESWRRRHSAKENLQILAKTCQAKSPMARS